MPYVEFEGALRWVGPAGAEVEFWKQKVAELERLLAEERKKNQSESNDFKMGGMPSTAPSVKR